SNALASARAPTISARNASTHKYPSVLSNCEFQSIWRRLMRPHPVPATPRLASRAFQRNVYHPEPSQRMVAHVPAAPPAHDESPAHNASDNYAAVPIPAEYPQSPRAAPRPKFHEPGALAPDQMAQQSR